MMTNIIWISISSGSVFHFKQVTLLTCRQLCTTVSSSNEHYSKITEWCETTSVTLVLWLLRRKDLSCSGRKLSGGVYNIPTGVHLTHHIQESGLWLLVVCWRMRREEQRNGRVSPLVFCFLLSLSVSLCVLVDKVTARASYMCPLSKEARIWFAAAVYSSIQNINLL